MNNYKLHLVGYACGLAGADNRVAEGPLVLQKSIYLNKLLQQGSLYWDATIKLPFKVEESVPLELIGKACTELAKKVSQLIKEQKAFCVLGGDHTSAVGTWSGVYDALHRKGDLGLIWIDAHMDSHTPETTETGNIHGMPLASLLGHGYPRLTNILYQSPKFKPEHVFLIGVRNFEKGEAELLKRLGVKVYFMEEVKERGFKTVLLETIKILQEKTIGYGISLDLDSIDPLEAPGVDVPEPDGISVKAMYEGLNAIIADPKLIGTEVIEFDPHRDKNQMTEKLIVSLLEIIMKNKSKVY